jgi:phosphoenolpyruvate synthase/pyruvate phosphate dikinase
MKWVTYVRGIIPLQRVYPTLYACLGKIKVVFYNKGKDMVYAWFAEDLKNKVKDLNFDFAKQIEKEMLIAISISEEYIKKEINIDNVKENYYDFFDKVNQILGVSNIYIDAFDEFYETNDKPIYSSYMAKLHNELLNLKNNYSENKLNAIIEKYWWTNLGWENMQPLTKEEIVKRLDHIHEKVEIVKTGDDIVSIFAELHDLRKELQMKSSYAFHKMINIISKEKNISIEDLDWLMPEELFNLDLSKIKERQKCMFFEVDKKTKIYYNEEAIKKGNELLDVNLENFVKWRCAFEGNVKGIARVCKGVQEAAKIKKGEILITGMTMPDYVPYMKIASAIVTNEGGITCHAAIISRELKIPCVVGTVHATEIFKTGDLIEVDANKGLVRKI